MGYVLIVNIGRLVAKYLAESEFSGTLEKNFWLNSFHTFYLPLRGGSLDPYSFLCSLASFSAFWRPKIFLDKVGSGQSGGKLSPFMGTACCFMLADIKTDKFQILNILQERNIIPWLF